jgi:hypothetical protein
LAEEDWGQSPVLLNQYGTGSDARPFATTCTYWRVLHNGPSLHVGVGWRLVILPASWRQIFAKVFGMMVARELNRRRQAFQNSNF